MSDPFRKAPDVAKDFGVNWASWLGALTISDSEWEAPAGITIDDDSFTTTTTTVRLSGGTDSEDYEVLNRITTSDGQTEEKTIVIQVREASWALTEDELVTVAEIIQESYDATVTWAENLNANQVASIRADLTTWAANRDSVDVELEGGSKGVRYKAKLLLNEIRMRVRKQLGLSLISDEVMPWSRSIPHQVIF